MDLLTKIEVLQIAGGWETRQLDTITPACFDALNYYSAWWFYGIFNNASLNLYSETYCAPDATLFVFSDNLDAVACLSEENAIIVRTICES